MTPDHKTVREALERIKFYSDDRKAVVLAEDALAALDRIEAMETVTVDEETKKATWIGQHVQRGFIAFNGELFSPDFYEIKEK